MAENNGIKFFKNYLQKLKSFFFSKDILSFLLFLFLSATLWFVNVLGKERETTLKIPVKFTGIPQNISIISPSITEISIDVRDQGLRLLSYTNKKMNPFSIEVKAQFNQRGQILITSEQLNEKLIKYIHLQPTTVIQAIHPDSINIVYEKLEKKYVPVKFISQLEFAPQYMLSDSIQLSPNKLLVFGPKNVLDTLQYIRTELFQLKDITDTASYHCHLVPTPHVRYSANETKLSLFVEQFTERKIQLPITAMNCPPHLTVRTFPAIANVTFTIGLSKFNYFKNNDIELFIDYNELKPTSQIKQKINIKNNKPYISNVRVSPKEVEFILEEKIR